MLLAQSALPGLDLAARSLGAPPGICHTQPPGAPDGGEQSRDDACCLVCQAAQLAKGTLPSPTFTLPTAGTAGTPLPPAIAADPTGRAFGLALARAPPALAFKPTWAPPALA